MFERAERDDIDELLVLRDALARWLSDRGIEQWLPGELPRQRLGAWVDRGRVHVHRHRGEIVAAVAALDDDPEIWNDGRVDAGYIHLLMVDRRHAGRGLGEAGLAYAEQQIRDGGGRVARLDTVATNTALQSWYERHGYRRAGTRTFEKPGLFDVVLFEKPVV